MEKSRRWHTDKRNLKKVWQDEFLFTEVKSKAVCLVCKQSVAVLKEYNIRRHYETKHSAAFSKYNGEERKKKANELLAKLRSEQSGLLRPSSAQESATRASYQISALIAKSGRAFATGEFVKECLAVAAEAVCPSQVRMFSQISLSRNTVTRRIEDMAQDIGEQIKTKASAFSAYSIACDESTDISDSAQLLVFLRGVNETFEVTQELAGIETLSGTTKGEDLFFAVERVLEKNEFKWEKMAGITTDGAPAMVGRKSGLATFVSQKVSECGGKVVKYHCILHQEQLCAKSVGLVDVMRDVVKIVNNICSKALSHRQFKALMDEMDAQYGDVLYHQEVRWLSRVKVLRRFFDLRDEIRVFQESKDGNIQVPTDKKWLSVLAFLVDVTEMLNVLNVQLQGKDQIITQLFDHVRAFKQKLLLLRRHLSAGNSNIYSYNIQDILCAIIIVLLLIIFRIICGVCIYIQSCQHLYFCCTSS